MVRRIGFSVVHGLGICQYRLRLKELHVLLEGQTVFVVGTCEVILSPSSYHLVVPIRVKKVCISSEFLFGLENLWVVPKMRQKRSAPGFMDTDNDKGRFVVGDHDGGSIFVGGPVRTPVNGAVAGFCFWWLLFLRRRCHGLFPLVVEYIGEIVEFLVARRVRVGVHWCEMVLVVHSHSIPILFLAQFHGGK